MLGQEIFREMIESALLEQNSLQLLSLAGIGYQRNLQDLPSWVPDLTCPPNTSRFNQFLPTEDKRAYRATLDSGPNIKYEININPHTLDFFTHEFICLGSLWGNVGQPTTSDAA